jgi:exoribonuclease R
MPILETKDYKSFIVGDKTFTDYKFANHCLPGDEVVVEEKGCYLVKRARYGYLVGVLELTSKYLYGHSSKGSPLYLFTPYDRSYPQMRVGCSEKDTSKNLVVLIEFLEWNMSDHLPRGNLIKTLGPTGVYTVERDALKWLYGLPSLKKEKDLALSITQLPNRPFVEGITVNIDPPGCKDIDDTISMKHIQPGLWDFTITIADVAEWVTPLSDLDLQAKKRGQTLYQNGVAVVPMFPAALSEGEASLLPSTTRLGVSLLFRWNADTQTLSNLEWKETQIKNHMSATYESILETRPFGFSVEGLKNLCSHLKGSSTEDPHEWIEELMLFYNKEAAKLLMKHSVGLLRAQSAADEKKVESWIKISPELRFMAYEAASYKPMESQETHASLGGLYCHASSPLRRYADLVNQRCIKAILRKELPPSVDLDLHQQLNQLQKKAKKHDRDYLFIEQIYLYKYEPHEHHALVLSVLENKTKVYVPKWKRIVSVKDTSMKPGDSVILEYYSDMKKVGWKERMIFKIRQFKTGQIL